MDVVAGAWGMSGTTAMRKKALRVEMRAKRGGLDDRWIQAASDAVTAQLMKLEEYQAAAVVCLFMALADEVRLDGLCEECRRAGRRVLLPAYRAETGGYGFREWTPDGDLIHGHWGIREPAAGAWATVAETACILVPGLAFDPGGGRIGYGGGHYDRLLKAAHGALPIGICFDFQVTNRVPQGVRDEKVDIVVTERRTMRCRLAE